MLLSLARVRVQIAQRAILPGMFYVMCGVELTGGLPCTLADVQVGLPSNRLQPHA